MKSCNRCRSENNDDAVYCNNCGHHLTFSYDIKQPIVKFKPFDEITVNDANPARRTELKIDRTIRLVGFILLIIGAIIVVTLACRDYFRENPAPAYYTLSEEIPAESDEQQYASGIHKYFYPDYMDKQSSR